MKNTSIRANNINPIQRIENPIQGIENTCVESTPKDHYCKAKTIAPNEKIYLKACSEAKAMNIT